MSKILERLKDEARMLSTAERLELVENLLGELGDFDGIFAAEWAAEAEDRLAAFRAGDIDTVSFEDVLGLPQRP